MHLSAHLSAHAILTSKQWRPLQDVYTNVVQNMRLPGSDLLFGIPVVMDTNEESYQPGMAVELTYNGQSIGVLEIESKWTPDKATEALKCYGTSSLEHPRRAHDRHRSAASTTLVAGCAITLCC